MTRNSKILDGLNDALAFAEGDTSRATIRTFEVADGIAREVAPTPSPGSHADLEGLSADVRQALSQRHMRQIGPNPLPAHVDLLGQFAHMKENFRCGYRQYLTPENFLLWLEDFASALVARSAPGAAGLASPTAPAGEPVAWAWDTYDRALGEWRVSFAKSKPVEETWRRNIRPLGVISTAPAQGGDGWLPIETAPRDGTPIWAYLFETGIRLVRWISGEEFARRYGGAADEYQGSFYEVADDSEEWTPRFWLPEDRLPASPSKTTEG